MGGGVGGPGDGGGVGVRTALLHQCLRSLPLGGTRQPEATSALLCGARHAAHSLAEPAAAQLGDTAAHADAQAADGGLAPMLPALPLRARLTHVLTPVYGSGTGQ